MSRSMRSRFWLGSKPKVWLVVHEDLDDQMEVFGAFTSAEGAESFAAWMNGPETVAGRLDYEVVEVPLDPPLGRSTGAYVIAAYYFNTTGARHSTDLHWDHEADPNSPPERVHGTVANGWRAYGKTSDDARAALAKAEGRKVP